LVLKQPFPAFPDNAVITTLSAWVSTNKCCYPV
jgi:hypothetical protein